MTKKTPKIIIDVKGIDKLIRLLKSLNPDKTRQQVIDSIAECLKKDLDKKAIARFLDYRDSHVKFKFRQI